jgi:hypothetical protein
VIIDQRHPVQQEPLYTPFVRDVVEQHHNLATEKFIDCGLFVAILSIDELGVDIG